MPPHACSLIRSLRSLTDPVRSTTRSSGYATSHAPLAGDWVQDKATAIGKWGDIKDWDTSLVKSFLNAFSYNRDQLGNSASGANEKAKLFNEDLSAWITSAVTDMGWMFGWARVFNGDISK